jgi:uncharacterized protein (DUF885 family)
MVFARRPHSAPFLSYLAVGFLGVAGCHYQRPGGTALRTPASAPDALAAEVRGTADAYLGALLAASPEAATRRGIPGAQHDRLSDNSAAGERAWWAQEDRVLAALRRLDPAPLAGRPEYVTYLALREELEASTGMRVCQPRLSTVTPMYGLLPGYVGLAAQQPVGTDTLRAQALARWRAFPHVVDVEIANLREGVRRGYTAPKIIVRRVVEQADRLLADPAASPFASPAARDSTPAFRQAFARVVANEIAPALRRYRDYLAGEYLRAARDAPGVAANPAGAACYRAAVRRFTTLDLSGDDVYRLGLRAVAEAESTFRAAAERRYGTGDLREAMRRLRADSLATFRSRDAIIPHLEGVVARARRAAPQRFGAPPQAALVVLPMPAFAEASSSSGLYEAPAADGSRPGVFRVNLGRLSEPGRRLEADALALHEGIPGHHFERALALERVGRAHPVVGYLYNGAFTEGWATYAEDVADELGLFSSDAARMGWLERRVFAAATLVIDAGVHAQGWTREQAIAYELAHSGRTPEQAAVDVDRRIGWPGQTLAYVVGQREIARVRSDAARVLGPRFDVRAFHDRVLEDGPVPLPVLRGKALRAATAARAVP